MAKMKMFRIKLSKQTWQAIAVAIFIGATVLAFVLAAIK